MAEFIKVAKISDIPQGTMKRVTVAGKSIAIAHIDTEFFAIDDTCSHEECSLGTDGMLDGYDVLCGCHGARFDVTSGKVLGLPATVDIGSYPVAVDGDDLSVQI